jgi:anhydro-N-acetylmuramic acid kinase
MSKSGMIVAGVMSGTSADGIDVALVKVAEAPRGAVGGTHSIRLLGHSSHAYSRSVRNEVLTAMNATSAKVADLARLNSLLGELYADAVLSTQRQFRVKADLVGCHGQTLYHQGEAQSFLGRKISTTWQTGEAAIIAARLGVPVVSDFRPADMAAGGKGAPLVSYLDYRWFHDPKVGRILQNIGGISNLTAIPAAALPADVIAFDTGPGNMVIDAITQQLFGRPLDRNGRIAAFGRVLDTVVDQILRRKFFRTRPPKTAGREEFGREFVREFLRECKGARKQDMVATATALTAQSIALAIFRFVYDSSAKNPFRELIVSGGGARNPTLMSMLSAFMAPARIKVHRSDEFGLPSEAKEAVAFALLAYETWHQRASNLPSATGAKRAAVLGKISYA